jgi:peptide/nickel transport system ATP-binding protein
LLVADEPTSSLDPSVQAKVLKLLLDLQIEKGLTMLFVTHDIGLARKIGDRIGVMAAGTMVEMGPSVQVLGKPLHPYTRLLIRSAGGDSKGVVRMSLASPGGGCPFASRCRRAEPPCFSQLPPQLSLDGGYHHVRCFRPQTATNRPSIDHERPLNSF